MQPSPPTAPGVLTGSAGLVSGEGVRLDLTRAGVGSRIVAAALDAAIQSAALFVLLLVDVGVASSADDAALAAVALTELVLVLAGYPIAMEWLTRGRTVGKMSLGLRVVRDDGGPIGFRQALTRGLAGLVLERPGLLFPLSTVVGVLTVCVSEQEKRIGDMMAGTIVVNERAATRPLAGPPAWVPPPLAPWAFALDLHGLDDRLALAVRQFLTRAWELNPAAQYALGEQLRIRVLAAVSPPPPPGWPTAELLTTVLAERRRRASTPVPSAPVPSAPVPSAPAPSALGYPFHPVPAGPNGYSRLGTPADSGSPFAPPG